MQTGNKEHLIVFDTTMRDGAQCPGASMSKSEKCNLAQILDGMGVDVIEAGFPASSPADFRAVQAVAKLVQSATICGLARANEEDVRRCGEAVRKARQPRIHTFIATSPIHMEKKLKLEPSQVIAQAVKAVRWAGEYTEDIEFSPEDAGRSDIDFLCRIIEQVIDAGATTINIPDTVGYTMPWGFGSLIEMLLNRIPNSEKAIWSVHCHNDLGLAVANSLSGVMHGARQVECTVNGIGERAGNTALEEVVMAVRTRQDVFPCDTRIDTTQLARASRVVSDITGFPVQPNKAIVGGNAFAHEAGIHQDGVLKSRETYEIMHAADVGWVGNHLPVGIYSGKRGFANALAEIGIRLPENELKKAFDCFKKKAARQKHFYDSDLEEVVGIRRVFNRKRVELIDLCVPAGTMLVHRASIKLRVGGREMPTATFASRKGPIDAALRALHAAVPHRAHVTDYRSRKLAGGTGASAEAMFELSWNGKSVTGRAAASDTVLASVKAYIAALNRLRAA